MRSLCSLKSPVRSEVISSVSRFMPREWGVSTVSSLASSCTTGSVFALSSVSVLIGVAGAGSSLVGIGCGAIGGSACLSIFILTRLFTISLVCSKDFLLASSILFFSCCSFCLFQPLRISSMLICPVICLSVSSGPSGTFKLICPS